MALYKYNYSSISHCEYQIGFETDATNWKNYFKSVAEVLKDLDMANVSKITISGDGTIIVEELKIYTRDKNNKFK